MVQTSLRLAYLEPSVVKNDEEDLVCEAVRDKEAVAAEASEMQRGSCLGPDHLTCGVAAAAAVAC